MDDNKQKQKKIQDKRIYDTFEYFIMFYIHFIYSSVFVVVVVLVFHGSCFTLLLLSSSSCSLLMMLMMMKWSSTMKKNKIQIQIQNLQKLFSIYFYWPFCFVYGKILVAIDFWQLKFFFWLYEEGIFITIVQPQNLSIAHFVCLFVFLGFYI